MKTQGSRSALQFDQLDLASSQVPRWHKAEFFKTPRRRSLSAAQRRSYCQVKNASPSALRSASCASQTPRATFTRDALPPFFSRTSTIHDSITSRVFDIMLPTSPIELRPSSRALQIASLALLASTPPRRALDQEVHPACLLSRHSVPRPAFARWRGMPPTPHNWW
jgi:hypothetical protein